MNFKNDGLSEIDITQQIQSTASEGMENILLASKMALPELVEKTRNLMIDFNTAFNNGDPLTVYQTITDLTILLRDHYNLLLIHQDGITSLTNELRSVEFIQKLENLLTIDNFEAVQSVLEFILHSSQLVPEMVNYYCEVDCLHILINFIVSDPDKRHISMASKILPIMFTKNINNDVEMNYITDDICYIIEILLSKCDVDGLHSVLKFLREVAAKFELPDEIVIEYFRSVSDFFKDLFNGDKEIVFEVFIDFVNYFIKLIESDKRFYILTIRMDVARTVKRVLSRQLQFAINVPPECMHSIINFYKTIIGGLPSDAIFVIKDREKGFYLNDIIPAAVSMARDETPKLAAIGIDFMNALLSHNRPIFWEFFNQNFVFDVCFYQVTKQNSIVKRSIFRLLKTVISIQDNCFAGWLIKGQELDEDEDQSFLTICADIIEIEEENTVLELFDFLTSLIAFSRPYPDLTESLNEQLEEEGIIDYLYNFVGKGSQKVKDKASGLLALLEEGEAL